MKEREAWLWALIAFLAASVHLFETGLSLDPAIYATISRNLVRSGDLWNMRVGSYFFPQFFEHPFLAFWIQGAIFKIFGASDWSARILGLLAGTGTFYYLFRTAELLSGKPYARLVAWLTLLSAPLMGRMATLYLEVPLMFFGLGAVFHIVRICRGDFQRSDAWICGLYLGLSFLTKGLAALPILGVVGVSALTLYRNQPRKVLALGVVLGTTVAIVTTFCLVQASVGNYPFFKLYISNAIFGKVIREEGSVHDILYFTFNFLRAHPVHGLLALLSPLAISRVVGSREISLVGFSGFILFAIATGLLGKIYYHYFYPLIPFVNLLAAMAVMPWWLRFQHLPWTKWAWVFVLAYQCLWQVLPFPYRKKPWTDFYSLETTFSALKDTGVSELQGVGLTETDWIYPAMSLWYWDMDTKLVSVEEVTGQVVLIEQSTGESESAIQSIVDKGYLLCNHSPRYLVYVNSQPLWRSCLTAGLDKRWIR